MRQLFGKEAMIIKSELSKIGFKQKETDTFRHKTGVSVRLLRNKFILSARSNVFEIKYNENKTINNTLEAINGIVKLYNAKKPW